jgi:isoquinoline 1-oxidoreductase alpha subunit
VGDSKITTIEGLAGPVAKAVQEAWARLDVPQRGYCQSGQVMAAGALLMRTKKPTEPEINEAMNGNLCRCATYHRIRAGVQAAAETL